MKKSVWIHHTLIAFLIAFFCAFFCFPASALSVAFVNPGKKDEVYWSTVSRAMQSAADNLKIHLEVFYAERDHVRQVDIVRMLAQRPRSERPDYIVASNDKRMGGAQLKIAAEAGIKFFFAFSSILPEDRTEIGQPRERYPNWIGTLLPRAEDAGYLTAKALIERGLREHRFAADGKLHMLAIAGDRSTESSVLRNAGMERAIKEQPLVVLDQIVYADWQRDLGEQKAHELYVRYPQAQLVWSGNDAMAFGAMKALEAEGGKPGKDRLFSAVNTSTEAMQNVIDGRLTALAGGHFMCGAWIMVMLYDYENGHDFANEGLELVKPMFILFTPTLAQRFLERFRNGVPKLNFRTYSKTDHPELKQYDFSFSELLNNDATR